MKSVQGARLPPLDKVLLMSIKKSVASALCRAAASHRMGAHAWVFVLAFVLTFGLSWVSIPVAQAQLVRADRAAAHTGQPDIHDSAVRVTQVSAPGSGAGTRSVGWKWEHTDSMYFAYTYNRAGRLIGQYCYPDKDACVYLLNIGVVCTKGHKYEALINSDQGSASVELVCSSNKVLGGNVMGFTDFDTIDSIVQMAHKIGIAVGMAQGRFRVERFDLAGSKKTIAEMHAAALKSSKTQSGSTPKHSTRAWETPSEFNM